MSAAYRIWVGGMNRDVTVDDLAATFSRFGRFSEGIRLRTDSTHRLGSEAVITFLNQQDAALALSVQHVGLDRVWVTWYQQRAEWSLFWENG